MSEQAWEVVNTKQKKQQKTQKKKEEKESQKKRELQEKQEEERRRKEVEDAFLQQYVLAAKNQSPLAPAEDTSVSNPFEAFKVIEKKQRKLAQNDMLLPEDDYSDEEGTGPKKSKKKSSKPKVKKPSVIKVAKQIDNKQLKEILVQYTTRYPENPEIQLKNLAEQFETIFNTADTKKAPITNDTPYSLMEKETLDTVTSFMSKSPEDSLVVFFWFLLTTLISVQKPSTNATNTSGIGLRLLLQIIAKHFPHIVLKNMNSIKTLQLNNCFDIIMYVFNQFLTEKGVKNGFAVWFNVLLPLVVEVNKTSNQNKEEILKYFDRLIELSKNSTAVFGGDEAAGVNAFERIFQEKSLPDRISKHKSKLLDPTFLFGKNRVPKKLFTMLLSHGASSRAEFREQVLLKCSEMLSLDDNCYSYWKDSYDTHTAESNNLMLWMTLHWDEYKLQEKFKAKELFEVLKSFTKVNKSMLAGEYQDKKNKKVKKLNKSEVAELTTVNATSKALRKKLTKYAKEEGTSNGGGSSNVLLSVLPVAVVVAGAAAYTILNCCNQEWCSNIEFMNQLLKCGI